MRRMLTVLAVAAIIAGYPVVAGKDFLERHKEHVMGKPTDDQALVYIIRPQFLGTAIRFWAFADDQFLGLTRGKSYTFALVPEGSHLFWSKAENILSIEMEAVGGQTYYFKQSVRMGGMKARVMLSPMSE